MMVSAETASRMFPENQLLLAESAAAFNYNKMENATGERRVVGPLTNSKIAICWGKRMGRLYVLRKKGGGSIMPLTIEIDQEEDGRWLAEVPELPGVLTYGQTRQQAIDRVQALGLRVLADRLDHGEPVPQMDAVFAVTP